MTKISRSLSYLGTLVRTNIGVYRAEWKRLLVMSFFMMLQNSMFFALWIILFGKVDNLGGWRLAETARMYGIIASAVGISLFFFNGARTIAYRVEEGTIDPFLVRPRAALPAVLFSSSSPASLGDILYGPLIWLLFGRLTGAGDAAFLVLLTLIGSVVFTAVVTTIYSLAFWLKGNTRFPDQLFLALIIFCSIQQHGQSRFVQAIMYTLLPAAFIVYWPTLLSLTFDASRMAGLLVATAFFVALAILVFSAGVRRYKRAVG